MVPMLVLNAIGFKGPVIFVLLHHGWPTTHSTKLLPD